MPIVIELYGKTPNEDAEAQTGNIILQDYSKCLWQACFCPADLRAEVCPKETSLTRLKLVILQTQRRKGSFTIKVK